MKQVKIEIWTETLRPTTMLSPEKIMSKVLEIDKEFGLSTCCQNHLTIGE